MSEGFCSEHGSYENANWGCERCMAEAMEKKYSSTPAAINEQIKDDMERLERELSRNKKGE